MDTSMSEIKLIQLHIAKIPNDNLTCTGCLFKDSLTCEETFKELGLDNCGLDNIHSPQYIYKLEKQDAPAGYEELLEEHEMTTHFKVKAYKQTGKVFSCWIESPAGIVTKIDLSKREHALATNTSYIKCALHIAIDNYLKDLETYFYQSAGITADALGSIHSNSFLASDFRIPSNKKGKQDE